MPAHIHPYAIKLLAEVDNDDFQLQEFNERIRTAIETVNRG